MEDVERVIAHPKVFASKLGISEDDYSLLRKRKLVREGARILQTASAFEIGATAASSTVIAALFAEAGILVTLGLAATPVGWVIAAGTASAAVYYGISWYLRSGREDRVDVVPNWITTPRDAFAVVLFNFFAPLGFRVAALDGEVTESERKCIENYFVREWGYSYKFVQSALPILESNVEIFPIVEIVDNLIEFKKRNPDCNYDALSKELTSFLKEVTLANGELHDLEVIFIQWLEITLVRGKPGFWDKLISAVRFNRGSKKKKEGEGDGEQGGDGGNAPNGDDGQGGDDRNRSSQEGQASDSTLVGRNFQSALRWAKDQL